MSPSKWLSLCAALSLWISLPAHAAENVRQITQRWDVRTTAAQRSMPVTIYQGESVTLDLTARRGSVPVDITGLTPVWTIHDWAVTSTWLTVTGTITDADSGSIHFALTPAQSGGLLPATYRAYVQVMQRDGTNLTESGVIAAQQLRVLESSLTTEYPAITPFSPLGTEAAARAAADTSLSARLTSETATRTAADTSLQQQINAISTTNISGTFSLNGGPLQPDYFTLRTDRFATAYTNPAPGTVTTNQDRIATPITTFSHQGCQLVPHVYYATNQPALTTTSTNAIVDNSELQVRFTAPGTATVTAALGSYARTLELAPYNPHTYTNTCILAGTPGSLRAALTAPVDAALTNLDNQLYTLQDHEAATYLRNTNCWAYNLLDLTCASPWNSAYGPLRAGTAITTRHIIYAAHYPMPTGTVLRFITRDNTVIERTLISSRSPAVDLAIGLLNADLPETITPALILPEGALEEYLPTQIPLYPQQIPAIYLNQLEHAHSADWTGIYGIGYSEAFTISALHPVRQPHYACPRSGDSGNPVFLAAASRPVLLCCWYTPSTGTSPRHYAPQLETAITDMGGPVTNLTYLDLTGYTRFTTNTPPPSP